MSFKDISYPELWQSFCSAKLNHLCNFGRAYTEEQFCEINFNLDQLFRDFLPGALPALLFGGGEPFVQFERGHYGEHSCEVI